MNRFDILKLPPDTNPVYCPWLPWESVKVHNEEIKREEVRPGGWVGYNPATVLTGSEELYRAAQHRAAQRNAVIVNRASQGEQDQYGWTRGDAANM